MPEDLAPSLKLALQRTGGTDHHRLGVRVDGKELLPSVELERTCRSPLLEVVLHGLRNLLAEDAADVEAFPHTLRFDMELPVLGLLVGPQGHIPVKADVVAVGVHPYEGGETSLCEVLSETLLDNLVL